MIDKELEKNMEDLLDIVVMGRACRNTANIKNRQPIETMFVKASFTLSDLYTDIIKDELNVKEMAFTDDVREFISTALSHSLNSRSEIWKTLKCNQNSTG